MSSAILRKSNDGRTRASQSVQPKYVATRQCLGIDISKDKMDVCLSTADMYMDVKVKYSRVFLNTLTGIKSLIGYLAQKKLANIPMSIVMEATGCYHENAAHLLHEAGYQVSVVLPNKSHNYGKSLNAKSKTDKADAIILAQFGLERALETWQPPNPNLLIIRQLYRERTMLQRDITRHKNQLHAVKHSNAPNKSAEKRHNKTIEFLSKHIELIESEIAALLKSDEELKKSVDLVTSVSGLGVQTVLTVIAETNGFDLIKNKAQLQSYAGYDVVQHQSGTSVKGKSHISKKGNSYIRAVLYLPSMSAMRVEGELKDFYNRILAKHPGEGKKALVAVQRKLLILIYTLYKNKTVYDPNYTKNKQEEQAKRQAANLEKGR
jgi:transposase